MTGPSVLRDPYTKFVSRFLFPLHERFKGHDSHRLLAEMETSQWWSSDRLKEYQLERLKHFLDRIGRQVPYYEALFRREGFDPRTMRSLSELSRLPFLTKALIRENLEDLKARDARGLSRFNTGGSSGEPLIFFLGKERVSHDVAAKWRATRWWGVDIGDPEVVIWGSPIELGSQDRIRAIRDRLLRTRLLPAFEMSDSKLRQFVAEIQTVRPRMLFGYPSALARIARYASEKGIVLKDLGIAVAFVTSEKLYDEQRELIEQVFGCPVANGYGGRDAGFIAHACPEGRMHITAEDIIIEIVDRDGHPLPAGEAGEIVVTHLATGDFPFVRYRTGDVGVLDAAGCPCGRGLPVLKEIQGRTTDFIVASDGTVMHGLALIYVLRDLPGVEAFKIVQESLDLTRVWVVAGEAFDEARSVAAIKEGFRARLGGLVDIEVMLVGEIPPEKSGKFRYVVSRVAA